MEIAEVVELIAVAFALLVGAVLLAHACRRSPEDDPRFAEVLDLVAWLLDRLERATGKQRNPHRTGTYPLISTTPCPSSVSSQSRSRTAAPFRGASARITAYTSVVSG